MIFQAVKDLSEISKLRKIPQVTRARARKLIQELFLRGFSPGDIEFLTGNRWKRNTISKYCKGLEVRNTSEKDKALALMQEFILADGNWGELDFYVKTKKNLKSEGLELSEVITFKKDVKQEGVDVKNLIEILNILRGENIEWTYFLSYLQVAAKVFDLGYTLEALETLKEKTGKLGGIEPFLKTVIYKIQESEFEESQDEFRKFLEGLKEDADKEERRREEIEHEIMLKRTYVDYAEKLLTVHKFDPMALQTVLELAEKYGEPDGVFKALNSYGSLNRLEEEIKYIRKARSEEEEKLKDLQRGRVFAENYIAELNQRIGVIQEKHSKSEILRNIANLLDNPYNPDMDPKRFLLISLHLLTSIRDYSETHKEDLPRWGLFMRNYIETSVNNLRKIMAGKL